MTTPTPLDQQRQFVRDFLAADKQRSQRESAAQQQHAAGEKATKEQYSTAERAAQQNYASAVQAQDDVFRQQQMQISRVATAIDFARRGAHDHLRKLGVPLAEMPPALEEATPQPPKTSSGDPLAAFVASDAHIEQITARAGRLLAAKKRRQALAILPYIGLAVAIFILAGIGYQFNQVYQTWSREQRLATLYQEGMATLDAVKQTALTNPVDGAMYVSVPAGEFIMGSPNYVGDDDEHPRHRVYLDAFWIMQTEVTNAQYAKCVAAGACSAPDNSRWQDAAYANHPVTYVDWNQANAYAQWAGGRLPTEAEWEKAARGTDSRTYPWGEDQPAASLANCCDFVGDTTMVGSYPAGASPYGALDMAGNVWEWTADWYDSSYYSHSPWQNSTGPDGGDYRVLRGGSAWNEVADVRVAVRVRNGPGFRYLNCGFRVVRPSPDF